MPEDFQSKPLGQQAQPQPIQHPNTAPQSLGVVSVKPSLRSSMGSFYRTNKMYVWAILAGGAVIVALAFFAFRPKPATTPQEAEIEISVESPETVASGGEAVFRIKLENKDTQKLERREWSISAAALKLEI
jgi:hypothetical protein